MIKEFNKIIAQGLEKLVLVSAGAAMLSMISIVGIIFVSVLMRKLINAPLHITEEVVGLLLSISLFLGLPLVTMRSKHVRVSLLADQLKDQWHLGIQIMALLFGIGFFTWLIIETVPWFEFAFNRNIKTETSRILLYPWMAAMPFSLTLTCLVLIARLFGIIDRFDPKDIKPKFSKISGKV